MLPTLHADGRTPGACIPSFNLSRALAVGSPADASRVLYMAKCAHQQYGVAIEAMAAPMAPE